MVALIKPFFSYYGSKHRLARKYGKPRHSVVVEPFAGSAGYSSYFSPEKVILFDTDLRIFSIWDFLIKSSFDDIMDLPLEVEEVADLSIPEGAKNLIGFWLAKGRPNPAKRTGPWHQRYKNSEQARVWGEAVRRRIARQVHFLENWEIHNESWDAAPNIEAHWHIDPPYQGTPGRRYAQNRVDYGSLSDFCKSRKGWVEVCEQEGAYWLPFEPLHETVNSAKRSYLEMIWTNETDLEDVL